MAPASSAELERFRSAVEAYADEVLTPYLAYIKTITPPKETKEINDPVWGTLTLRPVELVVLDSPLLQRLRRIRQLGVGHFVFPGATHTRLEHTLGVVHQVQRLILSINTSLQGAIDQSTEQLLRVSALCHDIGHGFMSHVSEKALDNLERYERVKLAFSDETGSEDRQISEISAYYMVGSKQFRELTEEAQRLSETWLPNDPTQAIGRTIIGLPISDEIPLLHELISGPFDADKLDYMPRDAQMAGVPVVTDIPRLIQKLRAVELPPDRLPQEVAATVTSKASYRMTGIAISGGRTLDELMLGRTLLFDKIYRHQKVRAAEAMVTAVVLRIESMMPDAFPVLCLRLTDDQLLDLDKRGVQTLLGREIEQDEQHDVAIVADLARRLRDRDLLVRCFAFAQNMPLDPYRIDSQQRIGLDQLIRETADPQARQNLIRDLVKDVTGILRLLGREAELDSFPARDLSGYLWIDPPEQNRISEIARAYLIAPDGSLIRFRDDYAESKAWADAYLLTRDIGYVFGPKSLSRYVYLASERLFRDRFDVRIPRAMLAYAKQEWKSLEETRSQLHQREFYSGRPRDLLPVPSRLTRADVPMRLRAVAQNLAGYEGPGELSEVGRWRLEPERVQDWVRQFQEDGLADGALRVAERIRLIGRNAIIEGLRSFIEGNAQFRGGFMCRLGEPGDSSAVTTYYLKDVAPEFELHIRELSQTIEEERPILFMDDFIGSGNQVISIIDRWLGNEPAVDLREERPSLPEPVQEVLRSRPLAFLFAGGVAAGVENLETRCRELDLDATTHVHIPDDELPRAFGTGIFRDESQAEAFQAACRKIGEALLLDPGSGHNEEWVQSRALGYGNRAFLVAFPYNTPSQTLTCLWSHGQVDGIEWMPLIPRRKKL